MIKQIQRCAPVIHFLFWIIRPGSLTDKEIATVESDCLTFFLLLQYCFCHSFDSVFIENLTREQIIESGVNISFSTFPVSQM